VSGFVLIIFFPLRYAVLTYCSLLLALGRIFKVRDELEMLIPGYEREIKRLKGEIKEKEGGSNEQDELGFSDLPSDNKEVKVLKDYCGVLFIALRFRGRISSTAVFWSLSNF